MKRAAKNILSSPNPAQLEMRILANHGADPRFAFLRGRWSRFWRLTKHRLQEERRKETETAVLGELAGYGSDEGESEAEGPEPAVDAEEAAKEARRARLRDWKEKRAKAG